MARSTARKRALNTLYEADEKGQDFLSLLAERLVNPGAQTPLPDYSVQIVRGVAEHERDIDDALNACSRDWIVPRMPVVDRNILRIGAWEIMYNDEIPEKVAIDEALGLAKSLCDANSPSFIHGVLAAVAKRPVPVHDEEAAQDGDTSDERAGETLDGGTAAQSSGEAESTVAESTEAESGDSTVATQTEVPAQPAPEQDAEPAAAADTADASAPADQPEAATNPAA